MAENINVGTNDNTVTVTISSTTSTTQGVQGGTPAEEEGDPVNVNGKAAPAVTPGTKPGGEDVKDEAIEVEVILIY